MAGRSYERTRHATQPPLHELTVREILPSKRFELPQWKVRLGADVIGHVRQSQRRSVTFFEALALHPITGEEVSLELSTDREERVQKLLAFWLDPLTSRQHLDRKHRQLHGLQ